MTKVVGFLGRAGSGKDTCALMIQDDFEHVILLSFAGILKRQLSEMLDIEIDHFHDRGLKEKELETYPGWTPRSLMTWYGSMMKEKFGHDFWIQRLKSKLSQYDNDNNIFIITDVRFKEEAEFIRSNQGTIVYVDRDNILGPLPENAHVSEKAVYDTKNQIDHVHIINDTMDLKKLKDELVNKLKFFETT